MESETMEHSIICDGPGPHSGDGSGVLGHADREIRGFYCVSDACTSASETDDPAED